MGIKIRNRVRGGSLCSIPCAFASIAQLVEQRTLNPWVVGSNPPGGTLKRFLDFQKSFLFLGFLAPLPFSFQNSHKFSSQPTGIRAVKS
jgi:hypothetical protein